jgi:succinate dehydrogenase / fumarate reductase flavoprotein subunit
MLDLLIIGSGISALCAANRAREIGIKNISIYTKYNPTSSLSCMAQGGINASISNQDDNFDIHIKDTLKASKGLADSKTVSYMCSHAKDAIEWLENIGVSFSKDDNGDFAQRKMAGSTFARTCYAEDFTGLFILNALYQRAIKNEINIYSENFLLNFITKNKKITGATFLDHKDSKVKSIYAKATIVATGGYCGLYSVTTNPQSTSGDGVSAALRAGVKLSNMEFVQFHPTLLKNSKLLVSESARGIGGKIVDKNGKEIVDALATRDEVSRAIFYDIEKGNRVFLDLRGVDKDKINHHLPRDKKMIFKYQGVDISSSLVEIIPAAHYSLGGIDVDIDSKSSAEGLYAIGECANTSVHGANRLGANSLLEGVVFGRKVAHCIGEYIKNVEDIEKSNEVKDSIFIDDIFKYYNQISFYDRKKRLIALMYKYSGIIKDEISLRALLRNIKQIQSELILMGIEDKSKNYNQNLIDFLEFINMLSLAETIVICSLNRQESRGVHFRSDYSETEDKFLKKSTIVRLDEKLNYALV